MQMLTKILIKLSNMWENVVIMFETVKDNPKKFLATITLLLSLVYLGTCWLVLEKEVIKVTDKDIKVVVDKDTGDRNDVYFLYTESIAYQLKDNLFYFRTRAADDYGHIKKDKCYEIQSVGIRMGFPWEMFENVIYFEEVGCLEKGE